MVDLDFTIEGSKPTPVSAIPQLLFQLRVHQRHSAGVALTDIHAIVLRCQVWIEPARRRYMAEEQERLLDLFGTPDRWGQTVRGLLWANVSLTVPPFVGSTLVELPVPCSYDFSLAATQFFDALQGDTVPLSFLFSGTVFYVAPGGHLQVSQVPWDREATFRLPASAWRSLMESHYPNGAWLCLRKDVFDRLGRYKSRHGLVTREQALEQLLATVGEPV